VDNAPRRPPRRRRAPVQQRAGIALTGAVSGNASPTPAGARLIPPDTDRTAFLAAAARWTQLDPVQYPFAHQVAAQLPEHDDREQFVAGIDLILAGIATVR
jgi:hypothetical protein